MLKRPLYLFLLLLLCSCTSKRQEVVAEVDGREIFTDELSQKTKQEIFDLLNLAYDIKNRALNDLVRKQLIVNEADKVKMTFDQFLNWYVNSKVEMDTKERLAQSDSIVYQGGENRNRWIQHLADSLYSKAHVKKYIYPPKQPECVIKDLCLHYRGNLKSSVTFIVASDFTCERCVEFEKTMQRIFDKYKDKVKFGYVNYAAEPTLAALACEAAGNQNKFWEFHDTIFKQKGRVDSTFIFNFAADTHLNIEQFKRDLTSNENYTKVCQTIDKLVNRGLFATPTIIVNDRLVYMTNSYEELTKLLDNEL